MDVESTFKAIQHVHKFEFDLKDEQKTVINAILDKRDVSVILPTGFGKSMCYVIPQLLMDHVDPAHHHTAMVVSPLISLMSDQQQTLTKHGIKSLVLTPSDALSIEDMDSEPATVIFCSPETLQTKPVRKLLLLKKFNERLMLLACDEAHCVSEWGESFRPEYRAIAAVRSLVDVPLLALTATATEDVQRDIHKYLMLSETAVTVAKLPDRPNIYIGIQSTTTSDYEAELNWLKNYTLSEETTRKTILFCRSYSAVYDIWSWLVDAQSDKKAVDMYHASTDTEKKDSILLEFKKRDSHIRVLVCTVAFGMGVGIPDVELIIHWGSPKNALLYWQEVGRAGREGQEWSSCTLLVAH